MGDSGEREVGVGTGDPECVCNLRGLEGSRGDTERDHQVSEGGSHPGVSGEGEGTEGAGHTGETPGTGAGRRYHGGPNGSVPGRGHNRGKAWGGSHREAPGIGAAPLVRDLPPIPPHPPPTPSPFCSPHPPWERPPGAGRGPGGPEGAGESRGGMSREGRSVPAAAPPRSDRQSPAPPPPRHRHPEPETHAPPPPIPGPRGAGRKCRLPCACAGQRRDGQRCAAIVWGKLPWQWRDLDPSESPRLSPGEGPTRGGTPRPVDPP